MSSTQSGNSNEESEVSRPTLPNFFYDLPPYTIRELSERAYELEEAGRYLWDCAERSANANGTTADEEIESSFIDVHVPSIEGHHQCWMFKKIYVLLEIDDAGHVTPTSTWRCLHCRRLAPWPISLTTEVVAAHNREISIS